MEPETLNDYERRRQENIRRNAEMMESLNLHRTASELSSLRSRGPQTKKPRPPPSSATRRSLRHRGISPEPLNPLHYKPISDLRSTISTLSSSSSPAISNSVGFDFDPRSSLVLKPGNSTKILPQEVRVVQFLPFEDRTVVVAGNGAGNLGFWDVDCSDGDGDGVYAYSLHLGSVTGISVHRFSATKIFTSSHDGSVRVMDLNQENSDGVICSSDDVLFHCVCQMPNDVNSLYIGVREGKLKVWDQREGKDSSFWDLHDRRINTIDFSTQNGNLMATSSSDGRACIWDLRNMKKDRPECLNLIYHERPVRSAYFSPSGSCLATTCNDDNIRILRGTNFGDQAMISHKIRLGKAYARAIWGWDDSYLFVGSTRAIDAISTSDKTTVGLESPHMNGSPICLAAHPYKLGSLVGITYGGTAFLWTKE